jgi:nucleoside-diphosphate-sugar epimerase
MLEQYKTILVTGGCGFIGSHLTNALLSLGKEVLAFDNLSTGSEKNLTPGAHIVRGDIRNPEHVSQAVQDADLIFHVAANPNGTLSVNHPRQDFEINTLGTFNVLEAASNGRVKKVVYVSSASVYGIPQRFPIGEDHPTNPIVPYGASKLSGEILCKSFGHTNCRLSSAAPFVFMVLEKIQR